MTVGGFDPSLDAPRPPGRPPSERALEEQQQEEADIAAKGDLSIPYPDRGDLVLPRDMPGPGPGGEDAEAFDPYDDAGAIGDLDGGDGGIASDAGWTDEAGDALLVDPYGDATAFDDGGDTVDDDLDE